MDSGVNNNKASSSATATSTINNNKSGGKAKKPAPPKPVLDKPLKALIKGFLVQSDEKRLAGASAEKHVFFQTIYFDSVRRRCIPPPYTPKLSGPEDISSFPKYPESAEDSTPGLAMKDKQAWVNELNMPSVGP